MTPQDNIVKFLKLTAASLRESGDELNDIAAQAEARDNLSPEDFDRIRHFAETRLRSSGFAALNLKSIDPKHPPQFADQRRAA